MSKLRTRKQMRDALTEAQDDMRHIIEGLENAIEELIDLEVDAFEIEKKMDILESINSTKKFIRKVDLEETQNDYGY